ncbi:MAG: TonB-dependent receptor domain-containing protein [Terriglobales bacterium]
MRLKECWAVLLCLLLLITVAAWAQEITGSIAGIVRDPSGAVLPGATVTVKNTDQNIVIRTLKTDARGEYLATYLPIGKYSITVQAEGFKKFVKSGIELNVNDKLMVSADMEVGAATQTVEVQANPLEVELRSAETAGLVTGTQIRELALNNRNYTQLVTLMPGVSNTGSEEFYVGFSNPITGGVNVLGISVNGQRTSSNNWTIDGADNVDRGSSLGLLITPSVDAIAEFKVLKSNYNAEFGRSGAAQVNVITRSGTSTFHGGAYEFWRNENLNADTYSTKENFRYWTPTAACREKYSDVYAATGDTPDCDTRKPMRYHNFGWNIGGPVTIPGLYNKNKDKTFFFFSQEFRRVITYTTGSTAYLPTQAEMAGNMEAPVCVSFNPDGTCAPGGYSTTVTAANAVSADAWAISQGYIKNIWGKVPGSLPTDPLNRGQAFGTFRNVSNYREELVKVDHVFGPRLSVYGRYTHDSIPTIEPQGLFGPYTPIPGVSTTSTNAPGWGFVGRATATFSPTTLLEAGYNFSYGAIISDPTGTMAASNSPDVKYASVFPIASYLNTLPTINYNGYFSNLSTHPYYEDFNRNHQVFANLTKIIGSHTLKFGGTYYHYQKAENFAGGNVPTFYFHRYGAYDPTATNPPAIPGGTIVPCPTGTAQCLSYNGKIYTQYNLRELQTWANFMMGRGNRYVQSSVDLYPDVRANQFEFFAQDEWRLRPNLTLTVGLRYSNFRQPTDANGMLTNFDPRLYDPAKAPQINPANGNIINPATANLLNGVVPTDAALKTCQKMLAANQVLYCWPEGTVAPYGSKAGNEYNKAFAPRIGIAWDPFGDGKTSVRAGYAIFYDSGLVGIFEQNIFYNPPFVQSIDLGGSSSSLVPLDNPAGTLSIAAAPKRVDSRVDPNFHTPYNQMWNLTVQQQITPTLLVDVGYVGSRANHLLGILDINQPYVGDYLNYPVLGNAQDILGATANCTNLAAAQAGNYSSCTTNFTKLNYIRPYKGWGPINAIRTYAMANYHSLQAMVQKRFAGSSLVSFSYTWSKALTDNQTDRSTAPPNSYDPHSYYGPTQQDRRHIISANFVYEFPWMKNQQGILGKLIGGWELSGITTLQSGTPYTVTEGYYSWDFAGQGCRLSSTVCGIRPDIIGDPTASANWTQTANVTTGTRVFGPTLNTTSWGWFNPFAFTSVNFPLNGKIRPGTSGPGVVYGPGMYRQDLSLFKNIHITERVKSQLRFEAFNVFNHTNPASITTAWANFNETSTNKFGQVAFNGDANFKINRILQLGLKINF